MTIFTLEPHSIMKIFRYIMGLRMLLDSMALKKGKEDNVQLCVYVDGKCVVDLFGTAIGDTDYNANTIQAS